MIGWLHVMIDVPRSAGATSGTFWSAALGWPQGPPWADHPSFSSFEPPVGTAYVHQQIGDHGPRIHLDVEADDLDTTAARLTAIGARRGERAADWQPMSSPGGFPFCLVETHRESLAPVPSATRDGHRLRLVQVCLDVPQDHIDREVSFWRSATGWRFEPSPGTDFAGKLVGDDASPVQLLIQRLDEPEGRTRAHIDLGTDDIDAAVDRLVETGATRGPTGRGWVVLTDPTGMVFCVTGNRPD
ncbi:MAG TPA: VOC family protein [Microlunatus sp.]|jgi:predicted enzyme related to lactoylglutathione lyase|nr:VOC family protein [Microlunatus sp.]